MRADTETPVAPDVPAAVERLVAAGIGRERAVADVRTLAELAPDDFDHFVAERAKGVPVERLIGRVRFRSIELLVGPGVFNPQPETSVVVDAAVQRLQQMTADGVRRPRCVDLCCGSGTVGIAVASEMPGIEMHAVELDPGAAVWARRNVQHVGVDVEVHEGDIADFMPEGDASFDLVVSNPPYVAEGEFAGLAPEVRDHDPHVALHAGEDGLVLVRLVQQVAARLLRPGGTVVIEHSDRQGTSAPQVLADAGTWTAISDHPDQDGLDRFVIATRL